MRIVELTDFLDQTELNRSVLVGFYGGGNYGDEFLLEVLCNLLAERDVKPITIAYQNPDSFHIFHRDFGYKRVNMYNKVAVFKDILKNKNIIVGGGGLWGLNFNFNVLLLSLLLFISRRLLGKKIYMLGIGYYNSTPRIGRVGAWLAGKSANSILARDEETYSNFRKVNRHTVLSRDIALYTPQIDEELYTAEVKELDRQFKIRGKTLFFTLRKLDGYYELIGKCLEGIDKPAIAGLMVPRKVRPDGYELLSTWQKHSDHLRIFDFNFNPLALFYFFRKHKKQLAFIGPQYHGIITAHLNDVPYLPIVYDNKVAEILKEFKDKRKPISAESLAIKDIQQFIKDFYGSR